MKIQFFLSSFALLLSATGYSQTPQTGYMRVLCVKAKEGKLAETRAFMLDSTAKLAKVRMDAGVYSSFVVAEAVAPAGRAARCDFHVVYGSPGFPAEQMAVQPAELQKAGVSMTVEQRNAKRDQLSYLVSTEYWRVRDIVGGTAKGGYVRVNHYKTKPGMLADWTNGELTGWKPLAGMIAKETPGSGWGVYTLALPGGTSLPYNAMTVDMMPNWAAVGGGGSLRGKWMKVHPEMDMAAYMDKMGTLAERVDVHTLRIIEMMRRP